MDFLLLVFCVAIVAFARPHCGNSSDVAAYDYLSVDNTNALRGIMAIAIVLHHLSEHSTSGRLFPLLNHIGYLLVAVFFFLSGYGLMVSFQRKGKAYLEGFWKRRILFFVIVLLLDTLLYAAFNLLNGQKFSATEFLLSFVNGHPLAIASWYIFVQIYFYAFFAVVYRHCNSEAYRLALMFLLITSCDLLFFLLDYPSQWIYSNYGFFLGLFWATYKPQINSKLEQNYFLYLVVIVSLFIGFSILPKIMDAKWGYLFCRVISTPCFALFVLLLLYKIHFVGCFWQKMSAISLEIYLLHSLVYRFFRSNIIHIDNDVLWALATIIISVLISLPAHQVNMKIRSALSSI